MRISFALGLLCLCTFSFAADPAHASIKKDLNVPAEPLGAALQDIAKVYELQLLYHTELAKDLKTRGAVGSLTPEEALTKILVGTGLSYKYLDSNTVTVFAQTPSSTPPSDAPSAASKDGGGKQSSQDFRVAQVDQTPAGPLDDQNQKPQKKDTLKCGKQSSDQGESKQSDAGLSEILVCGSRIMNVDVVRTEDDVQPYTIFDSVQIERSGATNVEDFLKQQLTMNSTVSTNSQNAFNISGTTSSINLRGLGSNETLILVDGRRSAGVSIDGVTNQPDINGIPLAAIERIEVLPSSASAIYGGAAVGGVVNIILKKNFNGGDLRYTYDKPGNSGADTRTVSGSYGTSFFEGRTQIMVGGQYSDGSPLLLQDRQNLIGRGISTILGNSAAFLYNPFQPFQGATPNIASTDGTYNSTFTVFTPTPLTLRNGTPLNSAITYISAGTAPGSNLSAGLLANAGKYNLNLSPGTGFYGLQSPFGTVPLTKSLFATIRQSLFDDVQLFTEFSTSSNEGRSVNNPFATTFAVPSTAPTNPFQQDVAVSFPSNAAAPETSDSVTDSATVGVVVPLGRGWSSEADYTWSRNSFEFAYEGVDNTAFGSALATGLVNPFVDTIAHPLNLTPYLTLNGNSGNATLNDLSLRASGPVGSLPAGRPTLTVGLEHRKEGSGNGTLYYDYPLTPTSTTDQLNFGQSQSTNSVYAEALVPLVASRNKVPGIYSLDLQVAGRSERYTAYTQTPYAIILPVANQAFNPPASRATIEYTSTNPTVGLKYAPLADITFRTSYSTAFLPPTALQFLPSFTPQCPSAPCEPITDPKNGETYDINYTAGGNPKLQPQTSRDWDFGAIWEPQEEVLQGLRMNLEYYKITQPNYITEPTIQQIVSAPALAYLVTRNSATGLITSVNQTFVNATVYKTSGWDLKIDYRKATDIGTFGLHAAGTFIKYDQRQYQFGSPLLEYAGYPNDGGEGKIKANASLSWEYRGWTAAWTTTYYSSYWQQGAPGSPTAIIGGPYPYVTNAQGGYTISHQTYHDIYVSYAFGEVSPTKNIVANKMLSDWTVTFGIKNVFNTLPPFDAGFYPYFYSPYGDPRLRDYRLSVRKAF